MNISEEAPPAQATFPDVPLFNDGRPFDHRDKAMRKEWLIHAFEHHRPKLHQFILRRMGCVEEADELTQDVFVRLIRYKHPETIDNLQAFLFTVAGNLVRDRIRRLHARRHNMHKSLDQVDIESDECIEQQVEWRQSADRLVEAIDRLHENERKALLLHRYELWTHARIAEEMETTVGVVRRYIDVALAYCRDQVVNTAAAAA